MESIEKLREMMDYVREPGCNKDMPGAVWVRIDTMQQYADEIEREISERYMELPVDADDMPIHVGDLIEFGEKGERLEVTHIGWTRHGDPTISYRRPNGTLDCSCIGSECHHVKPRTIEDVLEEFAHEWNDTHHDDMPALKAKYADELRSMGVIE